MSRMFERCEKECGLLVKMKAKMKKTFGWFKKDGKEQTKPRTRDSIGQKKNYFTERYLFQDRRVNGILNLLRIMPTWHRFWKAGSGVYGNPRRTWPVDEFPTKDGNMVRSGRQRYTGNAGKNCWVVQPTADFPEGGKKEDILWKRLPYVG